MKQKEEIFASNHSGTRKADLFRQSKAQKNKAATQQNLSENKISTRIVLAVEHERTIVRQFDMIKKKIVRWFDISPTNVVLILSNFLDLPTCGPIIKSTGIFQPEPNVITNFS